MSGNRKHAKRHLRRRQTHSAPFKEMGCDPGPDARHLSQVVPSGSNVVLMLCSDVLVVSTHVLHLSKDVPVTSTTGSASLEIFFSPTTGSIQPPEHRKGHLSNRTVTTIPHWITPTIGTPLRSPVKADRHSHAIGSIQPSGPH